MGPELSRTERDVLEIIVRSPGITNHELAQRVDVSVVQIESVCDFLRENGLVRRKPAGYFVGYQATDRGRERIN